MLTHREKDTRTLHVKNIASIIYIFNDPYTCGGAKTLSVFHISNDNHQLGALKFRNCLSTVRQSAEAAAHLSGNYLFFVAAASLTVRLVPIPLFSKASEHIRGEYRKANTVHTLNESFVAPGSSRSKIFHQISPWFSVAGIFNSRALWVARGIRLPVNRFKCLLPIMFGRLSIFDFMNIVYSWLETIV